MYYLLHDPADPNSPFEIYYDKAPDSYCYSWFHPSEFSHPDFTLFHATETSDLDVTDWCASIAGDATYVLHKFTFEPTVADVIDVLSQHPELLI